MLVNLSLGLHSTMIALFMIDLFQFIFNLQFLDVALSYDKKVRPKSGIIILPSEINLSRISQAKMVGFSLLYCSILATTAGVATFGLLPPIRPGGRSVPGTYTIKRVSRTRDALVKVLANDKIAGKWRAAACCIYILQFYSAGSVTPKITKLAVIPENHAMHAPRSPNVSFADMMDVNEMIIVIYYTVYDCVIRYNLLHF